MTELANRYEGHARPDLAELVREVRLAKSRRARARSTWRKSILAARAAGVPIRIIGDAAGVSHVRILQIIEEESKT